MKSLHFFSCILILLMLNGCHSSEIAINTLDELNGDWIVTHVGFNGEQNSLNEKTEPLLDKFTEVYDLMPLAIRNGNTLIMQIKKTGQDMDTLGIELQDENSMIAASHNDKIIRYKPVYLNKDTLDWEMQLPKAYGEAKGTIYMRLLRSHMKQSIFTQELLQWTKTATAHETNEAVKARLINLLSFDARYTQAIYQSGAGYINMTRMNLPFNYYKRAVAFEETAGAIRFRKLFYDSVNADTAYSILKMAVTNNPVPPRNHYMIEYADFFDIMAEYLKKAAV